MIEFLSLFAGLTFLGHNSKEPTFFKQSLVKVSYKDHVYWPLGMLFYLFFLNMWEKGARVNVLIFRGRHFSYSIFVFLPVNLIVVCISILFL